MFNKIKKKILNDWNYTNRFAYLLLTFLSVCCLLGSLLFSIDSKLFVVLSAIGCSGIVSVIVSALVEKANNRIEKKRNEKIVEQLLFTYDIYVDTELERAIMCCEKYKEIDICKEYTISDIRQMLDELDSNDIYFRGFPSMLERSIEGLSAINLLDFQRNDDGIALYSFFEVLKSYSNLMKNYNDEVCNSELLKTLVLSSLSIFDDINSARNKKVKYSISKDSVKYLLRFRKVNEKVKEEENAPH